MIDSDFSLLYGHFLPHFQITYSLVLITSQSITSRKYKLIHFIQITLIIKSKQVSNHNHTNMESNKNFDSQLQAYFSSIKHSIKQQHISYLKQHPELRQILNDFLSSCLLEQPQNVYDYAKKFFSYFNYQKDTTKFKPLVISGCSGVGKGTLVKKLLAKYPDIFQLSISYTTRNARQGQVHGREYYFVKKEDFEKQINKKVFVQYCKVHDNYYGTHKGKLNDIVSRGKIAILEIDLQGGQKVHGSGFQSNFIFIDVPSLEVLRQRLSSRGTQTEQVVNKRMKNAQGQLEHVSKLTYYERILNDNLEKCFKDICKRIGELYEIKLQ